MKAKYAASYEAYLPISSIQTDDPMKDKCKEFICIPLVSEPDYADGEEKRLVCPEPKCPKGYIIRLEIAKSPNECAK